MKWKRLISSVLIGAVLVTGIVLWRQQAAAKKAKAEEPQLETADVARKDLNVTVSASGVIEALTTVEVKSRSGGEIKRLFVEAGDTVRAGQLLAQLDPTQLKTKAAQASASVSSARAQTSQARLQAALQEVQTTGDLRKADAAVEAARASVAQSAEQLRQETESSASGLRQAEAALASAKARLAQAQAQQEAQPVLSSAEVERAQASLESARQNLARVKAGARPQELAEAQAALRSAEAANRNAQQALARQEALLAKGFASQQSVDDARQSADQANSNREQAVERLSLLQAGNRSEDIAQAQAEVVQAEAALKLAKANQVQVPLKQRDVEAAQQAVVQAEAGVVSAKAQQRNVQVRQKQLESARAALRQAEATLVTARSGGLADEAKKQQIQVAAAQLRSQTIELNQTLYDLGYANVFAPRSGVIMQKFMEEGTVVPAGTAALKDGTALYTIADTSQMFMLADVDEADMAGVKVGQKCQVTASVLPDEKLRGQVVKIFPQGKTDQNVVRFQVRIRLENPVPQLRPGMTADVTIEIANRKQVLVIPDTAINRTKGETSVDLMGADGQTKKTPVTIGLSNWDETEIVSGLKEGDKVVIQAPPSTGDQGPFGGGGGRQGGRQGAANGQRGGQGDKKEQADRQRGRMMMQFRMRQ